MPEWTDQTKALADDALSLSGAAAQLIAAAFDGDRAKAEYALTIGADVNVVDPQTGLCALHIAAGRGDLVLCKILIEKYGARFFPDRFGRWPTVVAAECRAGDEFSDYIAEKEAAFLDAAAPEPKPL